jgi:recombination protein RecT
MSNLKQALQQKQADEHPSTVKELLASPAMRQQIQHALPKHMSAERMTRIALTLMRQIPDLAKCEPKSFMGALMQVSQLGLEPGGALGHAYLIPFKVNRKRGDQWIKIDEVQVIIGYRGMIDLARRSGQIVSLSARAVYQKDSFSYAYGLDEHLTHMPYEGSDDPGAITHFYAVAKLVGGGVQFEVMSRAKVEAVRDKSQGYTGALANAEKYKKPVDSPWVNNFDEMGRKTVVRRLFKYLPVSIELQQAVGLDEQADAGINQHNAAVIDGDFDVLRGEEPTSAGLSLADIRADMERAADNDALDAAWDQINLIQASEAERGTLAALYAERDKALRA